MWPLRQWFDIDGRKGLGNDLTSLPGLLVAIRDLLRVKKGGLMHGGHPCNGSLGLILNTILVWIDALGKHAGPISKVCVHVYGHSLEAFMLYGAPQHSGCSGGSKTNGKPLILERQFSPKRMLQMLNPSTLKTIFCLKNTNLGVPVVRPTPRLHLEQADCQIQLTAHLSNSH